MPYSSTAEFAPDVAELLAIYDRIGLEASSRRCSEICAERDLNDGQRLTLADGVRRAAILRVES